MKKAFTLIGDLLILEKPMFLIEGGYKIKTPTKAQSATAPAKNRF